MAKSKHVVGLDIGSSSVKLVQLRETKKGYALQNFAHLPLPSEAIVDGAIMNSTAIVDAVQSLMQSQRIKSKEVAISVSGHSVIIKKISLPAMTEAELEESIQWEAEQYIPFDINDVNIDVEILNSSSEMGQMDVLLVAAKKDMINDYQSVALEAGLQPVVVDVDAFCVQNQFEANYGVPEETIVLLNIGASVINMNILSSGQTTFVRDISMGGNQFTEEIQKQLNVNSEEAETLKLGGEEKGDSDSVVPHDVERVIYSVSELLVGEIQRSLDFFAATSHEGAVSRIYLSGGTAKIPSIAKLLERRVGVSVHMMNPFKDIVIDERQFDPEYIREMAPMAAVAVGLGLRRTDES